MYGSPHRVVRRHRGYKCELGAAVWDTGPTVVAPSARQLIDKNQPIPLHTPKIRKIIGMGERVRGPSVCASQGNAAGAAPA